MTVTRISKSYRIALLLGLAIAGAQADTPNAPAVPSSDANEKDHVQLKDFANPMRLAIVASDKAAMRQARKNAFGAEAIQLEGIIGQRMMFTADAMHWLDWESEFIEPFASKTTTTQGTYVGLGKNLEALLLMSIYTGRAADLALKEWVFGKVKEAQLPDGNLGVFPEDLRGRRINCDTHVSTFVMKALAADGRITGNAESQEAADRLAKWVITHWTDVGTSTWGMENCFLEFGENGAKDQRYAPWLLETHFPEKTYGARRWMNQVGYNPIRDDYDPAARHVYYFTSASRAMLQLNQIQPDRLFDRPANEAVAWIKDRGGLLPGVFSNWERWTKSQFGRSGVYNPGLEYHVESGMHKCEEVCEFVHIAELMDQLLQDAETPTSFESRYRCSIWIREISTCPSSMIRATTSCGCRDVSPEPINPAERSGSATLARSNAMTSNCPMPALAKISSWKAPTSGSWRKRMSIL
jgi:hypothetical protein